MIPPANEVEASITRNIAAIGEDTETLHTLIGSETENLLEAGMPLPDAHSRLLALIAQATALVSPHVVCRSGCSHCCKMAVTISSHEADLIAGHLGITRDNPPMVFDQKHEVQTYMNVPCVFLKKNVCTIYEVRPIACRTHFNLSAYPDLCDTVNYPGNEVPNINWKPVWFASAVIHAEGGCTFADLRAFFPNGAKDVQFL
jgi:uncharacterized protein